jgi:hypothetical protein
MIRVGVCEAFDLFVLPFMAKTTQEFGMTFHMLIEMSTVVHLWLVVRGTVRCESQLLVDCHCSFELI